LRSSAAHRAVVASRASPKERVFIAASRFYGIT
jgi:hypothetical protein